MSIFYKTSPRDIVFILIFFCIFIISMNSTASILPTEPQCTSKIEVLEVLSKKKERADIITFEVSETDCDFLKANKKFASSSIKYFSPTFSVKKGKSYSGKLAVHSSMSPDGVVRWTLFKSPDFSKCANFSFTFGDE